MLVAAALCPHPPLLVPSVGVGLGREVDRLRAEVVASVGAVAAVGADVTYVVGAGIGRAATSFAPWAPGSAAAADPVDVPEPLPLPLLVGAWLTRGTNRSFVVVDPTLDPGECGELGGELAASAGRVALVVLGDGSACHDEKAPGYVDARAPGWDRTVHEAFETFDLDAIAGLDPTMADELLVAGRAPWQLLAGAARDWRPQESVAALHVLFGVGYHVGSWR